MSKKIKIDIESKTIILEEGFTIAELTSVLADIANYKIEKVDGKTESFGEVKYPFNKSPYIWPFNPTCIIRNPITTKQIIGREPVENPYVRNPNDNGESTKWMGTKLFWARTPNECLSYKGISNSNDTNGKQSI